MEDQKTVSTILIFLAVYCISIASYEFKCPEDSHWTKRAKTMCYVKKLYHCLFDTSRNFSMEICLQPDYLPEGFKSIYSGNRDAKKCSINRFSPFVTMTSDRYECVYQKPFCSEEGQIIFDNGTNLQDISCGCDYSRGYGFLLKPRHKCFCYPKTEDCTCYKQPCDSGHFLSKEYVCERKNSKNLVGTCPGVIHVRNENELTPRLKISPPFKRLGFNSAVPEFMLTFFITTFLIAVLTALVVFKMKPNWLYVKEPNLSFLSKLEQQLCVILKGREGTGKRSIVKSMIKKYKKDGYKLIHINPLKTETLDIAWNNCGKCLIYFDEITENSNCFATFKSAIEQMQLHMDTDTNLIVIVTITNRPRISNVTKLIAECLERDLNKRYILLDLDGKETFKKSDKEKILQFHLDKNNVSVEDKLLKSIPLEEPFIGFPRMCGLFCSHTDHIKLGLQYFRQPPLSLIHDIERIKEEGHKNLSKAYQYCMLINVLVSAIKKVNQEDANEIIKRSIDQIYKANWKSIKIITPEFFKQQIEESCHDFIIVDQRSNIRFAHPAVKYAVMISYFKECSSDMLAKCDIHDVLTFLRPKDYSPLHDEIILTSTRSQDHSVATRVANDIHEGTSSTEKLVEKLRKFTETSEGVEFLILIEEELKLSFPQHFSSYIPFFHTFGQCIRRYASESRKNEILVFNLAWEYISEKSKDIYLDIIEAVECVYDIVYDVLLTNVDSSKNSLLHYFMIWNGEHENNILLKLLSKSDLIPSDSVMKALTIENVDGYCPIHFAAILGRYKFLLEFKKVFQGKNEESFSKLLQKTTFIDEDKNDKKNLLQMLHFDPDLYNLQSNVSLGNKDDFESIGKLLESD